MFDIGWGELLLIGIVALIAIGPKELPGALRGFGLGANLTRQWTSVDIGNGVIRNIQNAPDVMAQARVFYALGGFSIDAIYRLDPFAKQAEGAPTATPLPALINDPETP